MIFHRLLVNDFEMKQEYTVKKTIVILTNKKKNPSCIDLSLLDLKWLNILFQSIMNYSLKSKLVKNPS